MTKNEIKAQLDELGVSYKSKDTLEVLQNRLDEALASKKDEDKPAYVYDEPKNKFDPNYRPKGKTDEDIRGHGIAHVSYNDGDVEGQHLIKVWKRPGAKYGKHVLVRRTYIDDTENGGLWHEFTSESFLSILGLQTGRKYQAWVYFAPESEMVDQYIINDEGAIIEGS